MGINKILIIALLTSFFTSFAGPAHEAQVKSRPTGVCGGGTYFCNYFVYDLTKVQISAIVTLNSLGLPILSYQANIPTKQKDKQGNIIYSIAQAVLDPSMGADSLQTDSSTPLNVPNPPKYNFICPLSVTTDTENKEKFNSYLASGYVKKASLGMDISCPSVPDVEAFREGANIGCDCGSIGNNENSRLNLCSSTYYGTLKVSVPCTYSLGGKRCPTLQTAPAGYEKPATPPPDYPKILAYIACMDQANSGDFSPFPSDVQSANTTAAAISYCNNPASQFNSQSLNLVNANLPGADLSNQTLGIHRRDMKKTANLYTANLTGANLNGANLKGTIVKDVNFTNPNLLNAIWTDGTICADKTCGGKAGTGSQ